MLRPERGETQATFLARALGDQETIEEHPDPTHRYNACVRAYREFKVNARYHQFGRDMSGAEILEVGEWNGIEFTEEDLDVIVSSFGALGLSGRVPLKFGHNTEQPMTDGQPALGWVRRIYKQGQKLLADFSDMPAVVYDAIKSGAYKFVSVELLRNVKADSRTIRWVLDAVSLLGADQPAVGTLKDLQALTLSRMPRLEHDERVTFRRGDNQEDANMALTDAEKREMEELRRSVTQLTRDKEESDRKLKEQADKAEKDKLDQRRAFIKDKFEIAIKANRILPATREKFERVYRLNDDKFVMLATDADIESFIKDHEPIDKPEIEKLSKDNKQGAGKKDGDTTVETGTNEQVFMSRAEKQAVKMGFKSNDHQGLVAATKIVMRDDPKLAKAYLNNPRGDFKPEGSEEAA